MSNGSKKPNVDDKKVKKIWAVYDEEERVVAIVKCYTRSGAVKLTSETNGIDENSLCAYVAHFDKNGCFLTNE